MSNTTMTRPEGQPRNPAGRTCASTVARGVAALAAIVVFTWRTR